MIQTHVRILMHLKCNVNLYAEVEPYILIARLVSCIARLGYHVSSAALQVTNSIEIFLGLV